MSPIQFKSGLITAVNAGAEIVALYPLAILTIVIVSVLGLNVISVLKTRYFHLATIPGPRFAAFTRLWLCKVIASGDSAKKFVEINKEYGPIARIGPNHLLTSDPEVVRRILAARSHYTRGPWFDSIRIDPHVPNIVSERDTGKHNNLRHRMSAGYSGKEILGTEAIIDERISELVARIEQKVISENGEATVFDIGRRIQYLAVDIITHLCFGKPLGFVEQDRDVHDFLYTIESQLPIVQHFSVIIEINAIFRNIMSFGWIKKRLAPTAKDKTGIGMIMGISKTVVDQRILPFAEPKNDMLGSFLKHGLTAKEAEAEISISLVAGSDTTATSMRATLLAIITNPSVYVKLQAEIDAADRTGLLSSPIRDSEARALPYLQACILEGLRCFPPITQLRERQVPPEGDIINGHNVPGGTFIGLNAWGLQLNSVFGSDPECFRPERWLVQDKDLLLKMQQVQELIFGFGNTKCLGIPIATMNLNKIFVELFRRFDISIANPYRPWKSECYGIFFQKEFNVRIHLRPGE